MAEFERSTTVAAPADDAFRYLADAANLPSYIATMVMAEPASLDRLRVAADVEGRHEEGEASFRADAGSRRLEWSGDPQSAYRGWLEVSETEGGSSVTVHLHTEREEDAAEVDRALDETVRNIKTRLE
jgi:hypothetical protein